LFKRLLPAVMATSSVGLLGCAHERVHGCRESFSYELTADGSLIYRGSVALPSGASAEPYRVFSPTEPDYRRHLERARNLSPTFDVDKRASGAEWVRC
jgi:hypothetical protein